MPRWYQEETGWLQLGAEVFLLCSIKLHVHWFAYYYYSSEKGGVHTGFFVRGGNNASVPPLLNLIC